VADSQEAFTSGPFAGRVTGTAPVLVAFADGTDPLGRTKDTLPVVALGVPPELGREGPKIDTYLNSLSSGAQAWDLIQRDPTYVLIDTFYGSTGGPQGAPVPPGSTITLTDARTGQEVQRKVAGVLADGTALQGIGRGEFRFPVLMSQAAARGMFGQDAKQSSVFLQSAPGQDATTLATDLQGRFLANGLVATDIQQAVKDTFAANRQFFQLMQGYLALGLLVGITSLGVIMIRAVRERRRTIGVLRALGFTSRTVQRSFMGESTFVALEGVVIGTLLGVVTTWLLYTNSPVFGSLDAPFPIAWRQIGITVGVTLVASLLATIGPARRAAHIKPAVAVRVSE
jgi:ABC-type antimicrobial peptide transport system permease subunit